MVSLIDIYNIKESIIVEDIRDIGDPARGDKGKNREKEFYFVDEPTDPETGRTTSKVVYKRSFGNMVKDIEAEAIDMKKLSDEVPDDLVIYKLAEELKEMFNTFRTHVRRNYPDEYKKINEALQKDGHTYNHEEVGEYNAMASGTSMEMALVGEEGILGNNGVFISWGDIKRLQDKYNKKLEEEEIEENSLGGAGAGASFNTGNSMAYMPHKKRKK
tara:strand:- start:616 stop:1263 length:648 start_codon:yes stop_codon:yes gene_type:complete